MLEISVSFRSSLAAGGRYDRIIGEFINNGRDYPAAGISFGLDAIFQVLKQNGRVAEYRPLDFFIIPLGTLKESLKLAQELRRKSLRVEVDISGVSVKNSTPINH
ncbi:ATP phosphoribosyltransferase regulatory subunit [Syntrophomonas wolfei]|uniref:Histidine--tRNA ligase (Histidyl-tRNA synthetase) n=1 Tax=Syntrophomonas wolfei subsp. wolfei (strain DSM 2245B / Goettingen) TaxID=335541 RepID=Q0AUN3_SYNWW|nr:ATP phosphoribosyltransferase regulatory subunit [Syntrophomonas wolfei]ABI69571.1 histidine--tRNA ligase (histidyl-tRNA synthetase) [Syntrophomonas wolfei subsp. wolfei str. Goettingen G311]